MIYLNSIITAAKITKPYTLAVNVYFHICYFKVSDSKEITQIQNMVILNWLHDSKVIQKVELQLRLQEWAEFIAGTFCLISV
jgi:hypothetical protein